MFGLCILLAGCNSNAEIEKKEIQEDESPGEIEDRQSPIGKMTVIGRASVRLDL